ncbi:hypothetical protein ZWY2020_033402 [Hordeum vulgare]|nr:hypothetical protein ZWY2020_033402 [Hordeum vulgare]
MPPSRVGLGRDAGPIVVAKPRDKFRFDWASTDDTSRIDAANNQPAHGALLLYGRGFLAGIDRREQKKVAAAALQKDYDAGAAATYDALDMRVDMHWTDKRADEMMERDRRILRKDFGMSYRGSRVPRPMQSWAKSRLGAELLRNVDRAGSEPTDQMAAVRFGLQARVASVAQTARKTAAVLSMLAYIAACRPEPATMADEGPSSSGADTRLAQRSRGRR